MDGETRRKEILNVLSEQIKHVSATFLANKFKISRQVIVQDIALLRATGYDILATARGYIFNQETARMCQRVLMVKHNKQQTEEELNIIIDNGGCVRNVIIMHPIYGQLVADLMLRTRRDIKQFIEKLNKEHATPLLDLTKGVHMHTVEATSEEDLDIIEEELNKHGFIINEV